MGEVVASTEEAVDLEIEVKEVAAETEVEAEAEVDAEKKGGDGSAAVLWRERFLPRMVLRVLLVEADDSTRQIIAALLRKCSYRVAAVSDGLEAWELLKGKPHNIDLILAEVDLPSISGYALLTLIMEHEICKNIPVLMMSASDSVSMVYKCMLRGAADFLVKPVRRNELRILWQHVWRRKSSTRSRHGPQDEGAAQEKVEVTAENNDPSNLSGGYMACTQRNRECIEKGSDTQSSCTKPDVDAEMIYEENLQDPSQPKSPASDMKLQKLDMCTGSSTKMLMHDCGDEGVVDSASKGAKTVIWGENIASESQREQANINIDACDNSNRILVNSSTEAIDLIGSFNNYQKCSNRSSSSHIRTNTVDSSTLLDLSLRRCHPSGSVNQVSDDRNRWNHSDASAFSRYVNRALQPLHSSASISHQKEEFGTNSDKLLSTQTLHYNRTTHDLALSSDKNMLYLATGQSAKAEVAFPSPQQPLYPIPIPARGARFNSICTANSPVLPSFQAKVYHSSNFESRNVQQIHNLFDQNGNNSRNRTELKQTQNAGSVEDRRHLLSATDQSASSSFCNGNLSHRNSIGCVSNGNINQVAVQTVVEGGNEGFPGNDRNTNRSIQREAALNKFRLKRKDRCYEKKVRYESRKKLAEQRCRVKGQFVRQVQTESAPSETVLIA